LKLNNVLSYSLHLQTLLDFLSGFGVIVKAVFAQRAQHFRPSPALHSIVLKKLGMKQKLRFSRKLGGLNWLANRHRISLG
jgi:hypothetical protein